MRARAQAARWWTAVALVSFVCCPLMAQIEPEIEPKPVPGAEERGEVREEEAAELAEEFRKDEVLVESLRGLVFVGSQDDIASDALEVEGVAVIAVPLLDTPQFRQRVRPFLGRPVTMRLIGEVAREAVLYCRKHDRPVVDVRVPEQDISAGTVQFLIVEGTVDQVQVEGARYFDEGPMRDQVRLQAGDSISRRALREDVRWLNRNPFRHIDVVLTPGETAGTTNVVLDVTDRRPFRVYGGYEDSGNELTGHTRWLTGFNWGNVFTDDDQLNYQFTASSEFDRLRGHALSYIRRLPWRHVLTLYGYTVDTDVSTGGFDIEGGTDQLGLRYEIPLSDPENGQIRHELLTGYEYKRSDSDAQFGAVRATGETTELGQFMLGYRMVARDRCGRTSLEAKGFYSPGGPYGHADDDDFEAARFLADPEYFYARVDLERLTNLPDDFTLHNKLVYQAASDNLLPSEQLGFGGYYSVRGFDTRALTNTDAGFYLRNELRTPPMHLGETLGCPELEDRLQFLVFLDYGVALRYDAMPGTDDDITISSLGPGLRYSIARRLDVRVDYGIQWHTADLPGQSDRWHVGVVFSY